MPGYIGRFAPSPTGLLHAGSLVAALASWLDARAHGGQWRVRMEDVDTPRCQPGAADGILAQLQACGLVPDGPVWVQSQRSTAYEQALQHLVDRGLAYPCACTRKDVAAAWAQTGAARHRHAELRYPGTCRGGVAGHAPGRSQRAWRLRTDVNSHQKWPSALIQKASTAPFFELDTGVLHWHDRCAGWQQQAVETTVGDFVLKRADGLWAYQLAVVVDDAAQGITHVVRGQDLSDNTPRQILLQRALGLPHPAYLHTPLVMGANGEKLSKQNGAIPLALGDEASIRRALNAAAAALGLPEWHEPRTDALAKWVARWADHPPLETRRG